MKEQLIREQEGWCGPVVLQWVAKEEGLIYSQFELVKLMGTTNKDGTNHDQLFRGASIIGLLSLPVVNVPIEQLGALTKGCHVIVNWMDGPNEEDDGHYSLLKKVEGDRVFLNDRAMKVGTFNKKWYDIENGKRINNWSLLIRKSKYGASSF